MAGQHPGDYHWICYSTFGFKVQRQAQAGMVYGPDLHQATSFVGTPDMLPTAGRPKER